MEIATPVAPDAPLSQDQLAAATSLAEALAGVTDPRETRGRRYSLVSLLLLMVAGLLCKATSLRAVTRWGRLHAGEVAPLLGFSPGRMPCCATLHRVLKRLDAQELDQCITTWISSNTPLASGEGIGVDGKTVRGVPGGLHLLAAYAHQAQVVVAQEAVDHKENEIKAAPRVLQKLQLKDQVVTGDAMLAQRSLSREVVAAGGDYFWAVKDNQPTLKSEIALLFGEPPFGEVFDQVEDQSRHGGRKEVRRLWASAALADYLQWPQVSQACQLEREVTCKGKTTREIAYAITSLTPPQADARRLLELWRGHWRIENGLHWVRDVVYGEDRCRIRCGQAPRACASLRNLALGLLRRARVTAITEALERHAAFPYQALALLGITS
jgi:predicted transposase YbfD/YdcC